MKRRPHGIHPRKPSLSLRMTEPEAQLLLELLDGVDRIGSIAQGMFREMRSYDNLAFRLRSATVRFPPSRRPEP